VEAGVLLGNLAGQVTGQRWRSIEEDPNLAKWGARGWYEAAQRNLGVPQGPAPANGVERVARKLGVFAGGALPFGPAAMVPAATATAGSEVGRVTDQAGLTGGYGEAVGAIAGGIAPGALRGSATRATQTGAPSNDQLRELAKTAYTQADDAGVVVNQSGLSRLAQGIREDLTALAFRPKLQPRVAATLDEIDNSLQAGNVTLKDIDTLRRVARNAMTGAADDAERAMASKMIDRIDDFVDDIAPSELVTGNAQQAATALKQARDYWKRLKKSELIDDAVERAERRAASTGTGGNTDNAIRQNIRAILDNPKKARMFTKQERMLMDRVVRGTASQTALRMLAGLSPDKGFFPLLVTGGAYLGGGPAALALPAAGYAARQAAEAFTGGNVSRLSEAVRGGARAPLTRAQALQAAFEEAQRRAALMGQTGRAAVPGALTGQGN
jgi:phage terminase Nu1 subunit (DNA packaging protein)